MALAIAQRDGKMLLIQRKDTEGMWDRKWEFPGGKVDPGESHEQAVIRELKEETGLDVLSKEFLGDHTHDWQLQDHILRVHLHLFHCHMGAGEVIHEKRNAHQTRWVSLQEAYALEMLEANIDILKRFKNEILTD